MTSNHPQATRRTTESDGSIDHEQAERGVRSLPEVAGQDPHRDGLDAPITTNRCTASRGIETASTTPAPTTVGDPTGGERFRTAITRTEEAR